MSALGLAIGGWLFLNLVIVVALLNRRSRPSVREKLFRWVIGERPFESPEHREVGPLQRNVRKHLVTSAGTTPHRHGEASVKIFAALAVIGVLVAGSVIFISTHPRSVAACAFSCD
jgi:hypothetical protein